MLPVYGCARVTGNSDAIFEFAMSAEWLDNGLIIRHPLNEETSAKGSQPQRKAGSGFGPRRSAPASSLPRAFRALRRRCRGRPRQTGRTFGCADQGLRCSGRFVSARRKTQAEERTSFGRASHRSFCLRSAAICKDRSRSRCAGAAVSRPYSRKAVPRGTARPSRR